MPVADRSARAAVDVAIKPLAHFMGGQLKDGTSGRFGDVFNPALGKRKVHGPEGVRFYTRLKTIMSRWPENTSRDADFQMPVHG